MDMMARALALKALSEAETAPTVESLDDVIITDPQNAEVLKYDAEQQKWINGTASGGGGGTSDYTDLTNKPQINGVTLAGDKSLSDLGIVEATELTNAQIDTIMNV